MINYKDIRENFIEVLNTVGIGCRFIDANSNGKKPAYPYATANVGTSYTEVNTIQGNERHSYNQNTDKLEFKRTEQPTMSVSINFYSDNKDIAFQKALDTQAHLKFLSQEIFSEKGIIIVDTTSPQDRSGIFEEMYNEYRQGFDVTIRVASELVKSIDYIKEVVYEEEGI